MRLVVSLHARLGVVALPMQLCVDRIGSDLPRMDVAPQLAEPLVVGTATQGARTVTGSERRRLVEEEELREATRLQQRGSVPAAELEPARDPASDGEAPADPTLVVVEASAVPVDQAARWIGDQLPERRDTVLQRHRRRTVATPR